MHFARVCSRTHMPNCIWLLAVATDGSACTCNLVILVAAQCLQPRVLCYLHHNNLAGRLPAKLAVLITLTPAH